MNFEYNRSKDHLLFITHRPDVVMERGSGCHLFDLTGKRYLDFIGGWATNCLGHSPPVIHHALTQQSEKLVNSSPSFYNKPMLEFATLLAETAQMDRVFFGSSGAEANESAIKLARKYGQVKKKGAFEIIAIQHGFHGRTLATMSLSGKEKWKHLFEPKVEGFIQVPINDLSEIRKKINQQTCAIFLELIQGEGGVNEIDPEYLSSLKQLAEEHQILLIFDEIQTGFARTGKLYAYEHYLQENGRPIRPDILTLGKGIGGGFPLSALLTTESLNLFSPGDNGGTYSGQPLAMAVGKAVLTEILRLELWQQVEQSGREIKSRLLSLSNNFPISKIRGRGLLLAFSWNEEKHLQMDAVELGEMCFEAGLIINALDPSNIRLIPPLTVSNQEVEEFFNIFESVIKKCC